MNPAADSGLFSPETLAPARRTGYSSGYGKKKEGELNSFDALRSLSLDTNLNVAGKTILLMQHAGISMN